MKVSKKQKRHVCQDNDLYGQSCHSLFFLQFAGSCCGSESHRRPERGLPLSSIPDTVVKMKEPWKALSRRRK